MTVPAPEIPPDSQRRGIICAASNETKKAFSPIVRSGGPGACQRLALSDLGAAGERGSHEVHGTKRGHREKMAPGLLSSPILVGDWLSRIVGGRSGGLVPLKFRRNKLKYLFYDVYSKSTADYVTYRLP